ncbi:MAG: replication factor C large subunit [Candidatus Pacearchaeota archaeon]|nr:replication factor C large subunit [Candidatus Pacearchaeota archaeon]
MEQSYKKEELWAEKYRPKKLSEVLGHEEIKKRILDFVKNFTSQKKRAMLLSGAPGSGKTSMIYALANELHLEIIELNASDFRNKDQIQEVMGKAIAQQSLFAKSKVILVDELEGIAGHEDRGGVQELLRLIETTTYPIMMVCNDPWKESLRKVRSKSLGLEVRPLWESEIVKLLSTIASKEKIAVSQEALQEIAKITKGDARAALNDLQASSILSKRIIEKKDIAFIDAREKEVNIFEVIRQILKTREALGSFDQVQNFDLDDLFLWLDENIPKEYHGKDLENAYETLSLADVYRGRIHRQQHWRFLVYIAALLTQGIAIAKEEDKHISTASAIFTKYSPPSRILKIWMANQRKLKKKAIAEKLAKITHTSRKQAMIDLGYLKVSLTTKPKLQKFSEELRLEPEETEWLEH